MLILIINTNYVLAGAIITIKKITFYFFYITVGKKLEINKFYTTIFWNKYTISSEISSDYFQHCKIFFQ